MEEEFSDKSLVITCMILCIFENEKRDICLFKHSKCRRNFTKNLKIACTGMYTKNPRVNCYECLLIYLFAAADF